MSSPQQIHPGLELQKFADRPSRFSFSLHQPCNSSENLTLSCLVVSILIEVVPITEVVFCVLFGNFV